MPARTWARTGRRPARAGACSITSRRGRTGRSAIHPGCDPCEPGSVGRAGDVRWRAMSDRKVDYLLVGGGLAAANCARWLREEGGESDILLVGREPDPPYNRPDCSKGYLRGEESREDPLFRPGEWWAEQRIELLTRTSVTTLDPQARTAKLSSKDEVSF